MFSYFEVADLSCERLLADWRWLCPQEVRLVAANAFGDLFLQGSSGVVLRLNVSVGELTRVASSLADFEASASTPERRQEWFCQDVEVALTEQVSQLHPGQCFGYKTPIIFEEGTGRSDNVYVAGLYDYVSFLGDLHRQLKDSPNGMKVRLRVQPAP